MKYSIDVDRMSRVVGWFWLIIRVFVVFFGWSTVRRGMLFLRKSFLFLSFLFISFSQKVWYNVVIYYIYIYIYIYKEYHKSI